MDFTLTSDQELLRETARSLLRRACPPSLVRSCIEDPAAASPLWDSLRQWNALAGEDLVDHCLFLEETGSVLAPGPYFSTTALFAPLVTAIGHEMAVPARSGDISGTVAMANSDGEWVPNNEPVKYFVPEASCVDCVAVVSAEPGGRSCGVEIYERSAIGRENISDLEALDLSRRLATVDVRAAEPLGPAIPINSQTLTSVMERAYVALAAEMMGTVRWIFDTTLAYAKSRVQFGRPIGSFQAIKHKLADMAVARDQAWSSVYYAAMTIDAGDPDRHRAAHVAKVMAGEAARLNAKEGIQIHGGIGYTYEHDLHLYFRRAYGSTYLLGTNDWHLDRLAQLLGNGKLLGA